ncbi:uncharacterized protein LOC122973281 [Thunnus albacares]|uniref:uncharacterized protein LOC122973281 n=1 Tax=Thunnus albacares TaxID=8236 RepID=UPI001CF62255|nr:uncharacterized protein LOC122973281 [Thunnus albacares]
MRTFTLITALSLCSISWISVSVSESQVVEVQSGEEVTLHCINRLIYGSVAFWFRLVNRTKINCISVMIRSGSEAELCDGFQKGKFEMSANISTVSLNIKQVDSSDSGLYFCGFYTSGRPVFTVIYLNVAGSDDGSHDNMDHTSKKECDETTKLTSVILGGLTVFLVMVITGQMVKIRKLKTAATEGQNSLVNKNLDSDQLKDTALTLYSTTIRSRRPASQREVDTHVIYAACRQTRRNNSNSSE